MKLTGENRNTRGKTCPSATLSTINPTWTDLGSKPGLRGERPATNHLSHGTAITCRLNRKCCMHVIYKFPYANLIVDIHTTDSISVFEFT
jgi:hypothetical protein